MNKHIGEENVNTFGSEMVIVEYRNNKDIDIYFTEYDYIKKHCRYQNFKKGLIKCPYEKTVYNHGYIGDGKYRTTNNGKLTNCYKTWKHMLERCYSDKYQEKYPTYKECNVCEEWLCFQNFAEWYGDNYYEIDKEITCLDKDILVKGNKIYSPNTCIFVTSRINLLFTKSNSNRGDLPIGVFHCNSNKFTSRMGKFASNGNKKICLGVYSTPLEAFNAYKKAKEFYIKEVADEYKDRIPQKLYDALYSYTVDIDD